MYSYKPLKKNSFKPVPAQRKPINLVIVLAGLVFLGAGAILGLIQWNKFQSQPQVFPQGSTWGSFDVSGLTYEQAGDQIKALYQTPVDLDYQGSTIQVQPADLGFNLNLGEASPAIFDPAGASGFWNYLWGKAPGPVHLDFNVAVDDGKIQNYLRDQVATHYDQPSSQAVPVPGTSMFSPGEPGYSLDVDASVPAVKQAVTSLEDRQANLVVNTTPADGPSLENLEIFLKQHIQAAGFNGVAELYTKNLVTGQELHFAIDDYQPVEPGIAFSAASTIKIPILVSVMRRVADPVPDNINTLIEEMLIYSQNPPADELMKTVISQDSAPLDVSADMRTLGLKDTFLAGYFGLGSPL